jgi:molybdopterin molybdotransferase
MTGLLSSLGARPVGADYTGDSKEALADALAQDDADLFVVTGGSAAGPADRPHKVLADAADLLVDGVRCRPGHPRLLACLPDGRRVAGLTGNPFAALTGLVTLAAPLLAAWSGASPVPDLAVPCPAGAARRPGYTLLRPGHLDPLKGLQLLPLSSPASLLTVAQASHLLAVDDEDMAVLVPLPTGLCP